MKAFHEVRQYPTELKVWHSMLSDIRTLAHWHSEIEFAYVREGDVTFNVSDDVINAKRGDLVFADSGEFHFCPESSTGSRIEYLIFDSLLISNHYQGLFLEGHHINSSQARRSGLSSKWNYITQLVDQELTSEDDFYKDIVSSEIRSFLYMSARCISQKDSPQTNPVRHQRITQGFSDIISYIGEHYHEKLTLPDMASMAGFSSSHFSRLFKANTGLGFAKYLNLVRIKNATEMIESRRHRMVDISLACGFESIRNFNRVFLDITGTTPSRYLENPAAFTLGQNLYKSEENKETFGAQNATISY